jgi:Family of unknown function (DUF5317)
VLLALFSIAVGIMSGFSGGGRFRNVGWRRIRVTGLPLVWAVGLVLSGFFHGEMAFVAGLVGMGALAAFAVANTKVLTCMWLVAAGLCLNLVVTADNHGMPYSPIALASAGVRPASYNDTPKASALSHPERVGDQLLFLSDVIPIPPLHTVVSFGDLLVSFGFGAVTATAMWDRRPRRLRAPQHMRSSSPKAGSDSVADLVDEGVGVGEAVPEASVLAQESVAPLHAESGAVIVEDARFPDLASRMVLLEATGDPSVLIDLTEDSTMDFADVAAAHVVRTAFRRNALDDAVLSQLSHEPN